jgi:hypothetical protein
LKFSKKAAFWPGLLIIILLCGAIMIAQAGLNSLCVVLGLYQYSFLYVSIGFGVYFAIALAFLSGFLLGLCFPGGLLRVSRHVTSQDGWSRDAACHIA